MNYRRTVRTLAEELGELLSELAPADGTFGVFGNHDYNEGIGSIIRKLPKNIRWLTNSFALIQKSEQALLLVGIDDYNRGKPNLSSAFGFPAETKSERRVCEPALGQASWQRQEPAPFFKLLLSHNPDVTISKDRALLRHADLLLCGHTHGGQLCLPYWGPVITRTKQKNYLSGLHEHSAAPAVYVNRGVGYGMIGYRLLCPPEILVIELASRKLSAATG